MLKQPVSSLIALATWHQGAVMHDPQCRTPNVLCKRVIVLVRLIYATMPAHVQGWSCHTCCLHTSSRSGPSTSMRSYTTAACYPKTICGAMESSAPGSQDRASCSMLSCLMPQVVGRALLVTYGPARTSSRTLDCVAFHSMTSFLLCV